MTFNIFKARRKLFVTSGTIIALTAGSLIAASVTAAPPQQVTYIGTPIKTAVPGKSFTINWQVKNTGSTTYSNVSVIFHIPTELTHSSISPANSTVVDDTITWTNVPLAAGETLKPSITFTLDSGTALKTKKNIWVEVTGDDMEATSTNFSITAVSSTSTSTSTTTSSSTLAASTVDYLFSIVYERLPTTSESTYWQGRRTDKPTRLPLFGAMQFHKLLSISH